MTYEAFRQAREGKGWSIDDLARRTGLRGRMVELIEGGHFEELPAGLYGRSYRRNYATAVGFDPREVLEVFGPLVPSAEDPLDGLARRYGHVRRLQGRAADAVATLPAGRPPTASTPVAMPALPPPLPFEAPVAEPDVTAWSPVTSTVPDIVSAAAALEDGSFRGAGDSGIEFLEPAIGYADVTEPVVEDFREQPGAVEEDFDLQIAGDEPLDQEASWSDDEASVVERAPRTSAWWRPLLASAIDLGVLGVLGAVLVWLTALAAATSIPLVVRTGGAGMAIVFAVIVGKYFVLFAGVGNATPGQAAMRLGSRTGGRSVLNPRDVFARAYRSVYREDALVADDEPAFAERG